MHNILIAGAGKIGSTIARILADSGDYNVYVIDSHLEKAHPNIKDADMSNLHLHALDVSDHNSTVEYIKKLNIHAVVSCLPYHLTIPVAHIAKEADIYYFDLTEDIHAAAIIKELAQNSRKAFVPQCGLAPGFINIVATELIKQFDQLEDVKLRCGALPKDTSNPLQYSLTWSTDGLINEYGNPCQTLSQHKLITVSPLQDLEEIQIDGLTYEAFNTSGGIGSLIETYKDRINNMNYKTIRYPGHCEKMHFLMKGLKLNHDRTTLKRILENAVPITKQDVVIVYVSANGIKNNQLIRESYVKKFYPATIAGIECAAIQATTACGVCSIVDLVLSHKEKHHGLIKQEHFTLSDVENNRFGTYFQKDA